ncbi:MAG: hypothetical protein C0P74_001440 [Gammaproteobacteria bacterium]|nr:hypothetical protein [Gammaproteobacteria bacterium]
MAVPWMQIVRLVPSILEVSRELLNRTKTSAPSADSNAPSTPADLAARVTALEENERRQAELVNQMAEQIATLARAAAALHRQLAWLKLGLGVAIILALAAVGVALR